MIDESIVARILQVLATQPGLFDRLADDVTLERAHHYLSALESTPAPSQTTRWTRVPAVEALLRDEGVLDSPGVAWHADLDGTGNAALLLGQQPSHKRVWILTHLDQISYLVDPGDGARYPLVPLCYHMQVEGQQPALALAHDLMRGELVVRARGVIEVDGSSISFVLREGEPLVAGTRVVYDSQLEWDRETNCVRGYLDDSAACAAALLAAGVLRHYPVDVLIGLTDEEEGPPGDSSQSFGRGGRRLVNLFERPELVIVSEVQEYGGGSHAPYQPGDGAVFAERSSNGRGGVTPPHLYALQRHLAAALGQRGIRMNENWGGYVPRGEDINAVAVTPNVALMGILCSNRHYAQDRPEAHLGDVVDLAKSMIAYCLLVHSELWSDLTTRHRPVAPRMARSQQWP